MSNRISNDLVMQSKINRLGNQSAEMKRMIEKMNETDNNTIDISIGNWRCDCNDKVLQKMIKSTLEKRVKQIDGLVDKYREKNPKAFCLKYECKFNMCGRCDNINVKPDEMKLCEIFKTESWCKDCICGDCGDNIYFNESGTCTRCKNDRICPMLSCFKTTDDKEK